MFVPAGSEGLDLKSYDARSRAPSVTPTELKVPLAKPDKLPRTLQRGVFLSVGATALNLKFEDGTSREFYCPTRLITALKMTEWPSGTPVVIGVYQGFEGKASVVSLMPEVLAETGFPAGWTRVSPPDAPPVLRSPLGESFVCLCPDPPARVLFAGQASPPTTAGELQLYEPLSSEWRVAAFKNRVLVAPAQDYPILLESLSNYWLRQ